MRSPFTNTKVFMHLNQPRSKMRLELLSRARMTRTPAHNHMLFVHIVLELLSYFPAHLSILNPRASEIRGYTIADEDTNAVRLRRVGVRYP